MPTTKKPLYGIKPWDSIRNPKSIPYILRRGVASLLWREAGDVKIAYNPNTSLFSYLKAYQIIGASLVRGKFIKSPNSVQGRIIVTAKGKQRERELQLSGSIEKLERLKRARFALDYLDDMLVKLKADLESGVIQETS